METWPKATIALAIYQPNTTWLMQQLESLNQQDYEGELELLAWNDSPADTDDGAILQLLQRCITSFPYRLLSDGRNHGATRAFEKLTEAAEGKYIAYCDQDDIWLPGKVRTAVRAMEADEAILICHTGISLMDGQGSVFRHLDYPAESSVVNDRIYQQRRFILKNFAFGCAMLVRTDFARSVLPFPGKGVYHDQWLACCGACSGRVIFMEDTLLLHRIHDKNVSAILQGITTKKEYYTKKLARDIELIKALSERFAADCNPVLSEIAVWAVSRRQYSNQQSWQNLKGMLRGFSLRYDINIFEILLPFIPEQIFSIIIRLGKLIHG